MMREHRSYREMDCCSAGRPPPPHHHCDDFDDAAPLLDDCAPSGSARVLRPMAVMVPPVSITGWGEFAARSEASILDLNPSVEHCDVHRLPADA